MRGMVKTSLRFTQSKIHISLNLWTSPNSLTILGIIAYFVNKEGKLQSLVLVLKEVEGEHSGENLTKYVIEVIQEYKISKKVGYFIIDNTDNNNTLLAYVSLSLRSDFNVKYDSKYY